AAKPLGGYAEAWEGFVAPASAEPRIVIVGAGVAGAELAMASAHRLRQSGRKPTVTLLEASDTALPHLGKGARAALLAALAEQRIEVMTGARPAAVTRTSVTLASGQTLPADFILSAAGARPQAWLADTGLQLERGFVAVGPTLQSSDPAVFAVGDCAHMGFAPRPKAGVFAVRQAPILFHNLRAALSGGTLQRYRPQRDYLKLISTGGQIAIADRFGLRFKSAGLWRWKDRIDRKFMAQFGDFPIMPRPDLPSDAVSGLAEVIGEKPLCGGCGAKVGAGVLAAALRQQPAPLRADTVSGPGDDAGMIAMAKGVQVISTDHLRAFTHDAGLMARIAAIHALGDIWAMGAAPQAALSQITLPRLGPALQADMLAEVMAAAAEVFRAAGADMLGGHTAIGAELMIGFTVTGLAEKPIRKTTAQAGDAIILTKAIGSGTILAAEMAMAQCADVLLGEAVVTCLAAMQRPLGVASALLAPVATAMTDVTGFGLAGHLLEMLEGTGMGAVIDLSAVPFLPGAIALAAAGVASSIAPENRGLCVGRIAAPNSPAAALLFDPQTAGGLLATVPANRADALLQALRDAGDAEAAIIGHIHDGPVMLRVVD
ncbi:selenide, water dikinase SelD, partial [Pseudorhodobacter sp.]|uniref:selenide, water dikinase SelD n=1 Tax=Pseudorhodobacter sp. TaxID=1934400 RepID=UPI0026472FF5